ncbi:MAG TPA: protein-L-isoaspartate(D-aspartate) O-methyltransferase [bacterium]|nr:protein-L-isoaspartate(D-aspartate) O-methyltransferase [bacterium]HOM26592.1 protein-L-isoaspartate(D-aspartate) O-methyltransferase [bacterium]
MKKDFENLRREMVETQIVKRGISDKKVIDAFLKVPREEFVPENMKEYAYEDSPLPIGEGQTISQPYIVALMSEALKLKEKDKVLEIGTGSGYQAAILAEIGCEVYSVERIEALAKRAEKTLKKLGYNVKIKVGDGTLGWEEFSPYDKIIVTAASPEIPDTLLEQLSEKEGRLIIPVGDKYIQDLILVVKTKDKIEKINLGGCQFVPLIGNKGWNE